MRSLIIKLVVFCCVLAALCAVSDASAVWTVSYTDLFDRAVECEFELRADDATLDCTFTGEGGETSFFDEFFLRQAEAAPADGDTIVLLQDFDGLVGGSIDLIGNRITAEAIEITTQPEIYEANIVVWDAMGGFSSAGNPTSFELKSVSVPEPKTCFALVIGGLILFGLMSTAYAKVDA